MKFIKGFLINLQFFTAIPIQIQLPMDVPYLKNAVRSFPLLGLFQGFLYSGLVYGLMEWTPFSVLAISFALWLATILLTGGIHLDGWMDASDAYFSYGSREKRLEIMTDPRTGAFGVLSVIVLLSCRFFFIYEILMKVTPFSLLMIAFIPFLSKSVMGFVLINVQAAKNKGLASMFQNAASSKTLWLYPVYVSLAVVMVSLISKEALFPLILMILVTILSFLFIKRKAVKWFGGITGDVIGASVEGTEWSLWATMWLLHYFVTV